MAKELSESRNSTYTHPTNLNNSGQVVGIAANSYGLGDFVWFYDHATGVTKIDFDVRNEFTLNNSGAADIEVLELTDTGLVLGRSERHTPNGADAGYSLWLYDSNSNITYDLVFSQHSRGYTDTEVAYMSQTGILIGEYDAYDEQDEYLGHRYFYWSLAHGFHDLESLIVGDMAELGWETLIRSEDFSDSLKIIDEGLLTARGLRTSGGYMPFALVQIPEPATILLCAISAVLTYGRRERNCRAQRLGW